MNEPLLRKVDCVQLAVPELEAAIAFYAQLGHEVVWRRERAAGLRLPDTDAELVIQTERPDQETDFLVESADAAAKQFVEAGGSIVVPPFDIEIGRCTVVADPWGNQLVMLDMSKGPLS